MLKTLKSNECYRVCCIREKSRISWSNKYSQATKSDITNETYVGIVRNKLFITWFHEFCIFLTATKNIVIVVSKQHNNTWTNRKKNRIRKLEFVKLYGEQLIMCYPLVECKNQKFYSPFPVLHKLKYVIVKIQF